MPPSVLDPADPAVFAKLFRTLSRDGRTRLVMSSLGGRERQMTQLGTELTLLAASLVTSMIDKNLPAGDGSQPDEETEDGDDDGEDD